MKRTLIAVTASAMLALCAPAIASAHHRHHHGNHSRTHKRHASSARILRFGAARLSASNPTSSPTPPTSNEAAGKVVSFEGGVLTIMLTGGSTTVSGKVTEDTELRCQPATPSGEEGDEQDNDDQGGSGGGDQGQGSGGDQLARQHGDFLAHSADTQGGGGDDESQEGCTPASALVPGAVVLEAELKLGSAGPVWEQLVVVH